MDSGGNIGRFSPGCYNPGRNSSQYNEEKSSAVRFNSSKLYDNGNALKQRIRVDGTYSR